MNVLIIKLGATGDVVRTTPLLRRLPGQVTWVTAARNLSLLGAEDGRPKAEDGRRRVRCVPWEERHLLPDITYDLVINLEDSPEAAVYLKTLKFKQLFGAYADSDKVLRYTEDSSRWFDLSLISRFGRAQADKLKLLNRHSYQDLLFNGLGLRFSGEPYVLPESPASSLWGDVAIAAEAGPVWPMKKWAGYGKLKGELEARGLKVNVLPRRASRLGHLADIRNHRCLVSGDSLPMHLALGSRVPCVSLFTCTSPWEIHGYGLQTKLVSPLLEEFFYRRDFDPRATTAIPVDEVLEAVLRAVVTQLVALVSVLEQGAARKLMVES